MTSVPALPEADRPGDARGRMKQAAQRAHRNRSVRASARIGLLANGLVHALIGAIGLQVANGGAGEADQLGALSAIATRPGGLAVLWLSTVALWGLALWQGTNAAFSVAPNRRILVFRRSLNVGKALGFALLGTVTFWVALGARAGGAESVRRADTAIVESPIGLFVLLAVGTTVGIIGGGLVWRGVRRNFREELRYLWGPTKVIVLTLGVFGHTMKGVAFLVTGGLLVAAAVFADSRWVGGLDAGLRYLLTLQSGPVLLNIVAAGLIAFGLYLVARAAFLRH
ncbi:DUF1206 domain-containing protein [Cryobacterium sp. 1639]|uniref:DUF1206 domain-containing protein n=1 Tax=Cryobacterium inferilacus TaxID=2866629 RepID=UPI001C72B08F|nr:DUF1206 domain-containing protein [Cryobacterium sp. 1639]MBX0299218.1 DUF1206 domain-containing protein [Cryobacterium sp. 1639]